MTRYEAFIEKSWLTTGLTQVLVARIRDNGRADIGFFLVDLWCLGIKDAFFHEIVGEAAFRDLLAKLIPEATCERLHPACAKKLLDGAIAYAERLGFAPHRDYRKARRALSGLDAADCPETFTFGRDGEPCYVEGPNDTPERTQRVLAMLEARCGEGGYSYQIASALTDDGDNDEAAIDVDEIDKDRDAAREALREFFGSFGPEVIDFYAFAGLVAALQICPTAIHPTRFIERLIRMKGNLWRDEDDLRGFSRSLVVYWHDIADRVIVAIATPDGTDRPAIIDIYHEDFAAPDGSASVEDLARAFGSWCAGFMHATREWPEAWGDALTRTDLVPDWQLIRAWAEPDKPEHLAILTGKSQPARAPGGQVLPSAVLALARALRPPGPPAAP